MEDQIYELLGLESERVEHKHENGRDYIMWRGSWQRINSRNICTLRGDSSKQQNGYKEMRYVILRGRVCYWGDDIKLVPDEVRTCGARYTVEMVDFVRRVYLELVPDIPKKGELHRQIKKEFEAEFGQEISEWSVDSLIKGRAGQRIYTRYDVFRR